MVNTVSANSDKVNCSYPYFGLRKCGHCKVRHDPLEHCELNQTVMTPQRTTYKVVESSLQSKEEVGVSRLGYISYCTVGQNQVEANYGVNGKTILIGIVGISYRR